MEPFSIIIITTAISIFLSAGTATAVYAITKEYDEEEQEEFVISDPVLISCSEQREVLTNQDTQVMPTLPTINPAQDKFVEMLCALGSQTSKEISATADQVSKDVNLLGHKIAYGIYETTDGG
jgi:uncharacterized protein YccT (UPF0319 family)